MSQLSDPLVLDLPATHRSPCDDDATRKRRARTPLADIAAGLAASTSLDLLPEGTGRRYALLLETPAYEAWLIAWPSGTGLALHDHGTSEAAVEVVRGRLRERYDSHRGLQTRWLHAGDRVALPCDHVHELLNLDDTEAVSVHVYGPRLGGLGFHTDERELAAG